MACEVQDGHVFTRGHFIGGIRPTIHLFSTKRPAYRSPEVFGTNSFRPPDIVVGGLGFFLFLLFSSSNLRARLTELNRIRPHGRKYNLKMHVQNLGYPLPLQIGVSKPTFFGRLRTSMATLTANNSKYICLTKVDIDNRARALESTNGLLHYPTISLTLVHKWLKTRHEFLPTLTILFRPSPSHTFYAALT